MTVKRRQRGAVGAEEVVACAVDVDLMKHGSKSHGSEGGGAPTQLAKLRKVLLSPDRLVSQSTHLLFK